ncbi:hypothetical protein [Acetivibrio sp. MSJd-27]|uniref:hypothetical protein n=1 Tax=Acetivibrio sp. MSJd-27 TaxID=2841523 RepID=UPI001C11790B|nr:hypothetical protein [Acetivibrio sp. MSJd-27]MBU5451140.1 hypothetical protein [Acetivibrio sp. MSJd-27]
MSDLSCGCGNFGMSDNCCCNNGFGGNDVWVWIIIIAVILILFCGNGFGGFNNGCTNNCCC